ncbi:MAG: hypothetical protein ACLRXC_07940 [[Clostridium] leptum]
MPQTDSAAAVPPHSTVESLQKRSGVFDIPLPRRQYPSFSFPTHTIVTACIFFSPSKAFTGPVPGSYKRITFCPAHIVALPPADNLYPLHTSLHQG